MASRFKLSPASILLIALIIIVVFSNDVVAFGAGNIPSYGYLEGKAFRHGDIEDFLAQLVMTAGAGGNPFGFIANAVGHQGPKFSGLNIKRVYFGNWLRDYSQAVDVGTLGRGIKLGTIRILVWVMAFMAHGYATEEFEVTVERLGVYRPEEHIDNPRDYADNEDARKFDPRLRGPVDPRELEVDPRTGMKNYIANENGGWATSTAFIRQSFLKAIECRRRAQSDADLYEALRLLGQALHTLEDLSAHSNWVELALIEMGYRQVFPHVGEKTAIHLGGKTIFPLVTGTFGGMDFIHSLEATDHLSQTQITDVNVAVTNAGAQGGNSAFTTLNNFLGQIPGRQGREMANEMHGIQSNSARMAQMRDFNSRAGTFDPQSGDFDPEVIAQQIYPILAFRDRVVKAIHNTIEKIPGLLPLVEKITESLTIWVLTLLEPYIKPIVQLITKNLNAGSELVVSDKAQYEVFNNPHASDPTHSMLSKDHFSCYLNEPAGHVAIVIIRHAVQQIVSAWSDPNVDPHRAIDSIMTVFCHPALLNRNNPVQMEMFSTVERWINNHEDKNAVLEGLSKAGVRAGRHHDTKRKSAMGGYGVTGGGGHSHGCGGGGGQSPFGGYMQQAQGMIPGYGSHGGGGGGGGIGEFVQQAEQMFGGSHGGGGGGGIGDYISQAQQAFQGGGGGIGGFVQNIAGQMASGGGRRDINDESTDYNPVRQWGDDELDDSKDRTGGFRYPGEAEYEESQRRQRGVRNDEPQYGGQPRPQEFPYPGASTAHGNYGQPREQPRQQGLPYPRTPPVPENYGQSPPQRHVQPPFPPPPSGTQHNGPPPYGNNPPYPY